MSSGAGFQPGLPGDLSSCSALGAVLLAGAERLRPVEPTVAEIAARLGAQLQRFAVASPTAALTTGGAPGAPGAGPPSVQVAASRRGQAQAALRRSCRDTVTRVERWRTAGRPGAT